MAGTLHPKPMSIGTKERPDQADFPQQLIHDESDSCHIAAVLQQREEEKQQNDDRQKGQHTSHTGATPSISENEARGLR